MVIYDITGAIEPKVVGLPPDFELAWFAWASDDTILISVGKTVPWGNDEAYTTRLIALDRLSSKTRFLGSKQEGLDGDNLLWIDPEGKRILLTYQATIYDYPSVFSVDLATNRSTEVVKQRPDIWHWSADQDGVVRSGCG